MGVVNKKICRDDDLFQYFDRENLNDLNLLVGFVNGEEFDDKKECIDYIISNLEEIVKAVCAFMYPFMCDVLKELLEDGNYFDAWFREFTHENQMLYFLYAVKLFKVYYDEDEEWFEIFVHEDIYPLLMKYLGCTTNDLIVRLNDVVDTYGSIRFGDLSEYFNIGEKEARFAIGLYRGLNIYNDTISRYGRKKKNIL